MVQCNMFTAMHQCGKVEPNGQNFAASANANATFDFVSELIGVKSLSEVVELSTAHARKQFEAFTQQAKDLTAAAQKLATDTSEPLKTGVSKAFKKVA